MDVIEKHKKVILLIIGILSLLLFLAIFYKTEYSMEKIDSFEVNREYKNANSSLLLATQGSPYKNQIIEGIITHYKSRNIYIHIIDVSELEYISIQDYNAIFILHTWEIGKPPKEVSSFLNNTINHDTIIIMTTSGDGVSKIQGIDALSGESTIERVPERIAKIVSKLEPLLNY